MCIELTGEIHFCDAKLNYEKCEHCLKFQVYSSRNYWIGFNDKDSEGDWQWSDRLTSSYTNWDDKSPNNGGVSCAAFAEGGHWHDEPCMEKLPFICKRKGMVAYSFPIVF